MSTRAVASAIFPLPIDTVWSHLRDFSFPGKLISTISTCAIENNKSGATVGAIRSIKWKTGESRKDVLIALSDQYHFITWELAEAEPPSEELAAITSIRLYRVTEQNHTLVEWSCDYSSNITNDFILFNQKAFLENLREMRTNMTK